jgi:hypothetical protein
MAALVSLACCLSGNTKLCGDLRPADPKADRVTSTVVVCEG